MTRAFGQQLAGSKQTGRIVNISSAHAQPTIPRYALYAVVEGLTRGLAVDLGPSNIPLQRGREGYVRSEQGLPLLRSWTENPSGWVKKHTTTQQALETEITFIDCGAAAFLFSNQVVTSPDR